MQTLERLIADRVLEALQAREHIIVAPGGVDALLNEVAGIIAPTTATLTPRWAPREDDVPARSTDVVAEADDALAAMVDEIAERLMESDHVDDIFAEDRVIRRDAFRAVHDVLTRYSEGRIEVEDADLAPGAWRVRFDEMGYVVSTVARLADPVLFAEALRVAATEAGARLLGYDIAHRRADFDLRGAAADTKLALEEAIAEHAVDLIELDMVELPRVERVVQVPPEVSDLPGFDDLVTQVTSELHEHTGCETECALLDAPTLVAALTPLTAEQALHADQYLERFVERIEQVVADLQPNKTTKRAGRKKSTQSATKRSSLPRRAKKTGKKATASSSAGSAASARSSKAAKSSKRQATATNPRRRASTNAPESGVAETKPTAAKRTVRNKTTAREKTKTDRAPARRAAPRSKVRTRATKTTRRATATKSRTTKR